MCVFQYKPLSAERREIRLIRLQPGSKSSTPWYQPLLTLLTIEERDDIDPTTCVSCTLIHTSLDDDIEFFGLSYTWGDLSKTKPIRLDGELVYVTENLVAALRSFRESGRGMTLWVDAVCINQADDAEKSWQVQLMREIYYAAKQVIVWLGPAYDGSDLAMDKLNRAGTLAIESDLPHLRLRGLENVLSSTPPMDRKKKAAEKQLLEKIVVGPEGGEKTTFPFRSIGGLLGRPWWSRTWVLQEVAVARHVEFACGNQIIPIEVLNAALNLKALHYTYLLRRLRKNPQGTKWEIQVVSTPLDYRPYKIFGLWQNSNKQEILSLMAELCLANRTEPHWYYATDPRDRIFALLGLVSDAETLGIRPDYSRSCIDVYTDFARAFLARKDLNILRFAIDTTSGERIPGLPSWVPDWSHLSRSPLRQVTMPHFSACGNTEARLEVRDQSRLLIRGLRVDSVRAVNEALKGASVADFTNFIHQTRSLVSNCGGITNQSADQVEDAVRRTLITDMESVPAAAWRRATSNYVGAVDEILGTTDNGRHGISPAAHRIQHRMSYILYLAGRRPFVTAKGYLGLGPPSLQAGDLVVVFFGSEMPFAVRQQHTGRYHLVEECYVHGIMDGELYRQPEDVISEVFEIE